MSFSRHLTKAALSKGQKRGFLFCCLCIFSLAFHSASYAAEEETKEEAGEIDNETFLPVPPVNVTMFRKGRPAGSLTLVMQLKIENSEQRKEATKFMPRLSDAYARKTNRVSYEYFDVNKPVNVAFLSRVLQNETNKVLKHKDAIILISDIAVQKR